MRRTLSAFVILFAFVGILYAQGVSTRHVSQLVGASSVVAHDNEQGEEEEEPKRKVDFMADVVRPYHRDGDSIVCLIGNFAAHHNGAVIWCDSAVRYDDTHWGFFGRVVVNQDSIYMYGDSAIYDGGASYAEVYAPIVKVVDGDAMLYTYNFSFNTDKKIGKYDNGGVLVHDNNIIESVRGYYDAENHDIICVESVELHGDEYDMKSDSIIYNTDSEFARFFTGSEIWNSDGDYLSADEGYYDKQRDLYMVTRNGYILSAEQQVWGDTLSYYREDGHVVALNNIQMDDFKNKMLAFGDYAEYWQERGEAILTKSPSLISYETSESDTVFMSADTLHIITIDPKADSASVSQSVSTLAKAEDIKSKDNEIPTLSGALNSGGGDPRPALSDRPALKNDTLSRSKPLPRGRANLPAQSAKAVSPADAPATAPKGEAKPVDDSWAIEKTEADSTAVDSLQLKNQMKMDSILADSLSKLTPKQRKAYEQNLKKEQALKAKKALKRAKAKERKVKLDSIAAIRQAKATAQWEKESARELEQYTKDSVRRAALRAKLAAKGKDLTELDIQDSIAAARAYFLRHGKSEPTPIEGTRYVGGKTEEEPQTEKPKEEQTLQADSAYRVVKAFRNVRIYRSDAQAACDSLVTNSVDSIVHMFIEPLLWNNKNQIAAQNIDLFSKNQQLIRAEFTGEPIMVAQIDTTYYNQVAGKSMTALFENNEIYRNDVDGNVQTIYFQQQEAESIKITEMIYLESASASFYIEDKELVGMTYRNDTPFKLYPLNLIPANQPLTLKNFKWKPELRPTRESIFGRQIRESQREKMAGRKRPTFNIVERMDRRKEQLLMSGEWVDREDQLTPELLEWREECMRQQ